MQDTKIMLKLLIVYKSKQMYELHRIILHKNNFIIFFYNVYLFIANAASSSSPSDDGPSCSNGNKGNGGAQNGGNWSFEEQYKQVRQVSSRTNLLNDNYFANHSSS